LSTIWESQSRIRAATVRPLRSTRHGMGQRYEPGSGGRKRPSPTPSEPTDCRSRRDDDGCWRDFVTERGIVSWSSEILPDVIATRDAFVTGPVTKIRDRYG